MFKSVFSLPDITNNVTERRPKRQRTESGSSAAIEEGELKRLSDQQLDVLVNFFNQCPEPDANDISELAKQICCSLDDVGIYFQYLLYLNIPSLIGNHVSWMYRKKIFSFKA